ncbi:MAG: Clp protease N-terminal domain-containing protein [Pseudonocardia sp.]|nr:Clp protease N-terminal domain-containing protein [Pseudonocardia sp.]
MTRDDARHPRRVPVSGPSVPARPEARAWWARLWARLFGPRPAAVCSPELCAVLRAGEGEARRLGHGWIGTEHLLLGLLGAPHSRGGAALAALGCPDLSTARGVVAARTGAGRASGGHLPLTPRARRVLAAARPADDADLSPPDSGDLLVALAGRGGLATGLLAEWVIAAAVTTGPAWRRG